MQKRDSTAATPLLRNLLLLYAQIQIGLEDILNPQSEALSNNRLDTDLSVNGHLRASYPLQSKESYHCALQ
jgi:hypothetical protein